MDQENKHTEKKRRRKWPWVIPLCILIVIGLFRLALVTRFAHRLVKDKVAEAAGQMLKPRLAIGKLSGDLWNQITLTNITLTQDSTVASIDTLYLKYNLLSYFGAVFKIDELKIVHPVLKLKQLEDSTWNAEHWLKSSSDTSGSSAAFAVRQLMIKHGEADVFDSGLGKDGSFVINNLKFTANNIHFTEEHYKAAVDTIRFNVMHTRLDAPVSLVASAFVSDSSFKLSKFAVATGHSSLNASGKINFADTTGHFKVAIKPLGWKDVAVYAKDLSIHKNINMSLGIHAGEKGGTLTFKANAAGIKNFLAKAKFRRRLPTALTSLVMSADRIDLGTLMGDTTTRQLNDLKLQARGLVPLKDYQHGRLEGTLSAKAIHEGGYQLDALNGTFSFDDSKAKLRIKPLQNEQYIIAEVNAGKIWSENPRVSVTIKGSDINPAVWIRDKAYIGRLNFAGLVSGEGWFPEQNLWSYKLTVDNSKLMGHPVDKATFSGRFNQQKLTNQSDVISGDSEFHLTAEIHHLQNIPEFSYLLHVQHLNLADVEGFKAYSSDISGLIQGQGSGNSLQNLTLRTGIHVDSSTFMKEPVQILHLKAHVVDSILTIPGAVLKSAIADGSLSGHIDLKDLYNSNNRLNIQARIKQISPFAPLAGVDILRAKGTLAVKMKPSNRDSLEFIGHINLHNINYTDAYRVQELYGTVEIAFQKHPHYSVGIQIEKPEISSVSLQKISLKTSGRLKDSGTKGNFHVVFADNEKSQLSQSGIYRLNGDTTIAEINKLTISGPEQVFTLAQPFHARLVNGVLQTDTLQLSSGSDSAYVALSVPYADSLHQKGFVKLDDLQLAPLQKVLLGQVYLKGTAFAGIHFSRSDTGVEANGNATLSGFSYGETKFDSVQVQAKIENNYLKAGLDVHKGGKELVKAGLNIPFYLQYSDTVKKSYSTKPVSGYLTVKPVDLSEFGDLLSKLGMSNTKGTFQLQSTLKGSAEQPQFAAQLSLTNGSLSEIPVDSLTASIHYQDKTSALKLKTVLTSLHQKMLVLNAEVPFKVDLLSLDTSLPEEKDSLSVDIRAKKFNMKVLNDFMNHKMARNLEGFIDGNVHISGPRKNLQTSGTLILNKGALRLVGAGIRLDHIQSTIQFNPDKIELVGFKMKSGGGSFRGSGQIGLDKLKLDNLDLSFKAQNFKIANTADYQALINANINIKGEADSPKVSGKLTVLNGFVKLHNFGEKSVEAIRLDTTQAAPATQTSLYDSLSLDLDLSINPRFYVRNERYLKMQFGLEGSLNIMKKPDKDLQVFGTINTVDGYAEPLGKHFELEKGALAFSGPVTNPSLDIRTLYEPPRTNEEVKIWYLIKGTVEDPQFKYESDPPMDLASILSYTLFGQPMYALNPGAQSAANAIGHKLASNFVMEFLANRVESIATTKLGIDVVKIENTHVGGKSGTAITTGWYINPRVFFAIQNVITGSTPSPGFYLEYSLKKNLKLILSQGTGDREGIGADLQWEYDY